MTKPEPLRLHTLIFCRTVAMGEGQTPLDLLGMFREREVNEFPVGMPRVWIYLETSGAIPATGLEFRWMLTDSEVVLHSERLRCAAGEQRQRACFAQEIVGLKIPKAGRYIARILTGATEVGATTIEFFDRHRGRAPIAERDSSGVAFATSRDDSRVGL